MTFRGLRPEEAAVLTLLAARARTRTAPAATRDQRATVPRPLRGAPKAQDRDIEADSLASERRGGPACARICPPTLLANQAQARARIADATARESAIMEFDALMLSRIQFAFTIAFHIIFPAFTIGLASWLVRAGVQLAAHRQSALPEPLPLLGEDLCGLLRPRRRLGHRHELPVRHELVALLRVHGNVLGPVIAYEVITAFFLEAAFLGIMLFGWERVGDRLHFFATCMVALGTLISAFWILSANSWMQTPDGYAIENGKAVPVDWFKVVFNPSFPLRYAHMVMGCYLTTAFAVAGMSAWMILRARSEPAEKLVGARRSMSMALWFAAIFAPVQIFIGDLHGLGVLKYQPTKLAAIEGNWDRQANMPLRLFAIPDEEAETNRLRDRDPEDRQLDPHPCL